MIGTKHFMQHTQYIMIRDLGLHKTKIEQKQQQKQYRFRYCGNRLTAYIGDWLYKDATIYLERKHDKYLLAKTLYEKRMLDPDYDEYFNRNKRT